MKPIRPILPLAFAIAAANLHAADRLTVYSGDFDFVSQSATGPGMPGYALLHASPEFVLVSGRNALTLSGLPPAIDAASVQFESRDPGAVVRSQRFDFALADPQALLRRALGQRVRVQQAGGGAMRTLEGELLAVGDSLTLRGDDGRITVLAEWLSFELAALPEGLHAQPTLRWEVEADRSGARSFDLDYALGGLAWRAEHVARLSFPNGTCRMRFDAAAAVLNRSGASFEDVELLLVAGEPRIDRGVRPQPMYAMRGLEAAASMDVATEQASAEYHAYALPGLSDLPDQSVQRVVLQPRAENVSCTRRYEVRADSGSFRPAQPIVHPDFGHEGQLPAITVLEFSNAKTSGLGRALPAGRLRVFESGSDGDSLLGEARIDHIAVGREVRAELGEAFDLGAQRTRESVALDDDGRGLTEKIALTLHNAKSAPTTIRVVESVARWTEWEIVDSSAEWNRIDAQRIAFDIRVPSESSATLRYSVRYRWPQTIKPQH